MKHCKHAPDFCGIPFAGHALPDWLWERYLAGTWELTAVEAYEPRIREWIPAEELTPGECRWQFAPHPQKTTSPEAFLPGRYRHYLNPGREIDSARWYVLDGEMYLDRQEPLDRIREASIRPEKYRIEPFGMDRCRLYSGSPGTRNPNSLTWRYPLVRIR